VRVETAKVASRGGNGKGQGTKGTRIWMARRDVDAAAIARWGGLGVRGVRRCPEGRLGGGRIFRPARPGVPIPRAGIIDGTEAAAQEQASTIFYFLDVQEQDHVWLLPDTTRPILWSLASLLILAIFLSWTRGLDSRSRDGEGRRLVDRVPIYPRCADCSG
jgi:hypothetical protein